MQMSSHSNIEFASRSAPLVFKTGGIFVFIGAWFLLIGLGLVGLAVALAFFMPGEAPPIWMRVGLLVFASVPLAAAVLGFLLTFGGERVALDAGVRQVRIGYGRWWTWKRETRSFDDFHAVEIRRQSSMGSTRSRSRARATHPVRLLSGGDEVQLADVTDYQKARAIAERVADYTGLSLHDATEGETAVREAGTLDESLAERARRLGEDVQWPTMPPDSRVQVHHLGDATVLDLPRPNRKMILEGVIGLGFLLAIYGGAFGGAAYFLRGWLEKFGVDGTGSVWPVVIWTLALVPVVYILLFGVALMVGRERVAVSPRVFKRIWRFPVGAWTRKIPADEIEELLGGGDAVIVRTDRGRYRIGFALDKEERRWLHHAVRYLLVKGPR